MSEGKCRLTPDQVKELSEVDSHQHPVLGPAFATVKKGSVNAAMAHIRQLESTVARLREALGDQKPWLLVTKQTASF